MIRKQRSIVVNSVKYVVILLPITIVLIAVVINLERSSVPKNNLPISFSFDLEAAEIQFEVDKNYSLREIKNYKENEHESDFIVSFPEMSNGIKICLVDEGYQEIIIELEGVDHQRICRIKCEVSYSEYYESVIIKLTDLETEESYREWYHYPEKQ